MHFLCKVFLLTQIIFVFSSICDQHPGVHPSECCMIPPLYDEEMMSDCRVQYRDMNALKVGSVNCFVLCALSASNASTKLPNTIESLASVVSQKYQKAEPQLATVIQNALYTCMNASAITKGTTGLTTKIGTEEFVCDPNALLIKGCIAIEIFMNCPSTRASNQTSCGTLRQYLNECRPH